MRCLALYCMLVHQELSHYVHNMGLVKAVKGEALP